VGEGQREGIAMRGESGKIFHRSEKDPIWGLKGRRRYCKYYQIGLLTSQQIWQALDQFYANNYPEYHPAWRNAYPQPLENLSFLVGCQEPNFAHCICGSR